MFEKVIQTMLTRYDSTEEQLWNALDHAVQNRDFKALQFAFGKFRTNMSKKQAVIEFQKESTRMSRPIWNTKKNAKSQK